MPEQLITTGHSIQYMDSRKSWPVHDNSVDLIITSPPYPMIEMWDPLFTTLNSKINIEENTAFELMHQELDKVWNECYRVLKEGGFACLNIGDTVRTINKLFKLYPNHARVLSSCMNIGFNILPMIFWRKQTNAPNKFMGSGTLPVGAYVTLENEFILVFRKGDKRPFKTSEEKLERKQSAFFWEERNKWFSDVWDFKGTKQALIHKGLSRSAAFPFELPYRLVNMYSLKGDVVLDPFLGTGTTTLAALASGRHSIGIEQNINYHDIIVERILHNKDLINKLVIKRLADHIEFVNTHETDNFKYLNKSYDFPVKTQQETELFFNNIKDVAQTSNNTFNVSYN